MAKLSIDLSGKGGLVDNFQGDINDTVSKPHLRYEGGESQMADGVYNPIRLKGYMSPANNKFADISTSLTNRIISRVYDSEQDVLWLAQEGTLLQKLDGLDDTSIATEVTNSTATYKDMELYEVNGERSIVYCFARSGNSSEATDGSVSLGFVATDPSRGVFTLAALAHQQGLDATQELITSGGNQKLAQKFRTNDMLTISVTGIRLFLTGGGTGQTWTLKCSIQTDSAGAPSGSVVTGTDVTIDPNTISTDGEYVYFTFASAVTLSALTTYHIVLEPTVWGDVSGGDLVIWWRTDGGTSLYANGEARQYDGASWTNADGSTSESFDFALILNRSSSLANKPGASDLSAGDDIEERSTANQFLQKADNGFLYWFTGNRIHKFDGGTSGGNAGNFDADVLRFPSYIKCVDAIDTNSLMYIAIQSSTTVSGDNRTFSADTMGVYIWDRLSTAVNTRNFIPIYGAREIKKIFVNAEGDIRVITIGEDRFTEIRGISNGKLVVIKRLGINAYPVLRDGFDYVNGMGVWFGADGIIYALGKVGGSEEIYKIGDMTGEVSGTLSSGTLISGHESSGASLQGIFISWEDNSTKNLQKWYPHGTGTIASVAQTGNVGNVYSKVEYLPTLCDIKHINIYCVPGATTGSTTVATLKFYANQSTTPFATKTVTLTDISKGYLSYELNKNYVNAFQVEIEWATGTTLGTSDFCPSVAILTYNPSNNDSAR